jgi:hypothetical protein
MVEHSAAYIGLCHVGRPSTHVQVFVKIGPIRQAADGTEFTKAARDAGEMPLRNRFWQIHGKKELV